VPEHPRPLLRRRVAGPDRDLGKVHGLPAAAATRRCRRSRPQVPLDIHGEGLSGDTYTIRQRSSFFGTGVNMIRESRRGRRRASCPTVGAKTSALSPFAIAAHPSRCAFVGASNVSANHSGPRARTGGPGGGRSPAHHRGGGRQGRTARRPFGAVTYSGATVPDISSASSRPPGIGSALGGSRCCTGSISTSQPARCSSSPGRRGGQEHARQDPGRRLRRLGGRDRARRAACPAPTPTSRPLGVACIHQELALVGR